MRNLVSRRNLLVAAGAGAVTSVSRMTKASAVKGPLQLGALLVDGAVNPMGLHNKRNRLSWQWMSTGTAIRQEAYQIGVSSTRDLAAAGTFDLWDSGRIASQGSFDIAYEGKQLLSRQRAWWCVRAWSERGDCASSEIAFWEMGLVNAKDWTGGWIAAEDDEARAERLAGLYWLTAPQGSATGIRTFRLAFDLERTSSVTLFVAMNAKADLLVDGRQIALPPVNPNAWGDPQPVRIEMPLEQGTHIVMLTVLKEAQAKAGILVRAVTPDGRSLFFGGRDAQARPGMPGDWDAAPSTVDEWTRVHAGDLAPMPSGGAYLLRRPFHVRGPVASARLYVTALGLYEAELNGSKVGDALLTPEFTDYRKRALYAVHDVTEMLRPGANVLGGIVGEGWYGSNVAPAGRHSFGPAPLRYKAQLEILYEDGSKQQVAGDDEWMIARSPITAAGIYDGEDYDARLALSGWSTHGFSPDKARWQRARLAPDAPPGCHLIGAIAPPIRRTRAISVQSMKALGPKRQVYDFGQNFAGWVRLRVRGHAGQRITLRFAELINADGSVDQSNLRGARATDTYILDGSPAGETYEPRFTYHGFRYVEVEGAEGPLPAHAIDGIVIHSDLAETGQLTLGSHVPQRLWENGLWSERSNFVGIPTDCPQRDERLGWMGDAHVFWDAAAFNMDVAAFTARFMGDVEDAQRANGNYSDFAPDGSRDYTSPGSSPGWADAGVILPWTVWWRYGDTGIIDGYWRSMTRFMESVQADNPGLIWSQMRGNDYADWLALDAKQPGDPTTPKDLVATAMWKAASDAMAAMAGATGRETEAKHYRALAEGLKRAFIEKFVRPDATVGNGSQTGYIQALHFDLLPTALRASAAQNLSRDIRRRGTLLSTGFLGTPYSLDVLAAAGEEKLVFDLLMRTEFPSWGYMIAKNATTIWERWNGDAGDRSMNSFNHYALGAVSGFLWRRIAGIDPTAPGFATFVFDPVYDSRLKTGGGRYESRSGLIATRWRRDAGERFQLQIEVPPNSQATVILPTPKLADVTANGRAPLGGIVSAESPTDRVSLLLQSGRHDIQVDRAVFG